MSDSHLHFFAHRKYRDDGSLPPPPPGDYGVDLVERYVEQAAARGVNELTFTEHLYRCIEAGPVLGPFWEQYPDPVVREHTRRDVAADQTMSLEHYVAVVAAAKARGLPVLLGLEVDFFPDTIDRVLDLLAPYPWDVLLGSIHWIDGWWFDRAHSAHEWERYGARRAYERYFELQAEMAASGTIDVVTHPDRVKYAGKHFPTEQTDLYAAFIGTAASAGVAIEVNTGGLRHPVHEIYPSPAFLSMAAEAGLAITFGSDGHAPEQAGWGLDLARAEAAEAGFTHRARFEARRRTLVPFRMPPAAFSS